MTTQPVCSHTRSPWIKWVIGCIIVLIGLAMLGIASTYAYIVMNPYREVSAFLLQNNELKAKMGQTLRIAWLPRIKSVETILVQESYTKLITIKSTVSNRNRQATILFDIYRLQGIWVLSMNGIHVLFDSSNDVLNISSAPFNLKVLQTKSQPMTANKAYMLAKEYAALKNYKESIKWLEYAIKYEHGLALNDLAVMYGRGQGVPKNPKKEMELYQLAANKGDGHAMYNIGLMILHDPKYPKRHETAAEWFIKSIENVGLHFCPANDLGMLYAAGLGVTQDPYIANKLFEEAGYSLINNYEDIKLHLEETFQERTDPEETMQQHVKSVVQAFSDYEFSKSDTTLTNNFADTHPENVRKSALVMANKVKSICWE